MGSGRSYSTREIIRVLKRLGYREVSKRGKGSHRWFVYESAGIIIARTMLPAERRDINPDTFQHILKDIRLTKEQFQAASAGQLDSTVYATMMTAPQ